MDDSTEQIRRRLAAFDAAPSALEGLPALREAAEEITSLLDRTMAQAVLDGASMRAVAASAGLTGNAVPPRLARTAPLRAYATGDRLDATGIARARYDNERGHAATPIDEPVQPLRFKPRRPT